MNSARCYQGRHALLLPIQQHEGRKAVQFLAAWSMLADGHLSRAVGGGVHFSVQRFLREFLGVPEHMRAGHHPFHGKGVSEDADLHRRKAQAKPCQVRQPRQMAPKLELGGNGRCTSRMSLYMDGMRTALSLPGYRNSLGAWHVGKIGKPHRRMSRTPSVAGLIGRTHRATGVHSPRANA